jgi:hypothetical protein
MNEDRVVGTATIWVVKRKKVLAVRAGAKDIQSEHRKSTFTAVGHHRLARHWLLPLRGPTLRMRPVSTQVMLPPDEMIGADGRIEVVNQAHVGAVRTQAKGVINQAAGTAQDLLVRRKRASLMLMVRRKKACLMRPKSCAKELRM